MSKKNFALEPARVYSRSSLAQHMGLNDRAMRAMVRAQRREGIPIVAVRGGGYKLAENDVEKRELLNMYRSRALDELTTYSKLMKTMQIDGQVTVAELIDRLEGQE